ncbi:MAG: hypothetical protein EBY48_09000 [Opitutae bacterium]|nr:hypothetical protein [Opitutae bacterium]
MALPFSGQITLNDIHIEAGGGSGTYCTINDSDIRAFSSTIPASGSEMEFSDWYGAFAASLTLTGTNNVGLLQQFQGNPSITYSSTFSQWDLSYTLTTGNGSYPRIGALRAPYNGTGYYFCVQGANVAATLNSYSDFGWSDGTSLSSWSNDASNFYIAYGYTPVSTWINRYYNYYGVNVTYGSPGVSSGGVVFPPQLWYQNRVPSSTNSIWMKFG